MLRRLPRLHASSVRAVDYQGCIPSARKGSDGMCSWHFPFLAYHHPKSLRERKTDLSCGPPCGIHWPAGRCLWVILPDLPLTMDVIRNTSLGAFQASTEMFGKNNRRHGSRSTFSSRFASIIARKSQHIVFPWSKMDVTDMVGLVGFWERLP